MESPGAPPPHRPARIPRILLVRGRGPAARESRCDELAEGLRHLGAEVDLREPERPTSGLFDLALLEDSAGLRREIGDERFDAYLGRLGRHVGATLALVSDGGGLGTEGCSRTFSGVVELGLEPREGVAGAVPGSYHFVFDGIDDLPGPATSSAKREIPWVHEAWSTPERVRLTDRLVHLVAPNGLVYLPGPSPGEPIDTSPLSSRERGRILAHARFSVWYPQGGVSRPDARRFKEAWRHGCVPIQVTAGCGSAPPGTPFSTFLIPEGEVPTRLVLVGYGECRRAFEEEYRTRPRLDDGLAKLLTAFHLPVRLGSPASESRRWA